MNEEISNDNLKQFLKEFKKLKTVNPDPVFREDARVRLMNKIFRPIMPRRNPFIYRYAFLALLFFVLPVGIVSAAQSSLPGEPLYQVKVASEKATLAIAPAGLKPFVKKEITKRREKEQEKLQEEIKTQKAKESEDENSASESAEPSALPLPSPSRAAEVLQRVLEKAPEQAIKGLNQALESVSKPKEKQNIEKENKQTQERKNENKKQ